MTAPSAPEAANVTTRVASEYAKRRRNRTRFRAPRISRDSNERAQDADRQHEHYDSSVTRIASVTLGGGA